MSPRGGIIAASRRRGAGGGDEYLTEVLADSPVGFWRFHETSGPTAFDASGNDLHGTYQGSPTLGQSSPVPSPGAASIVLNGTDQWVALANSGFRYVFADSFTAEAWIRPTIGGDERTVIASDGSSNRGWRYRINPLRPLAFQSPMDTVGSSLVTDGSTWYHTAVVFDGGIARVYRDGALLGTESYTDGDRGGIELRAGARNGTNGEFFGGGMCEVAVYFSPLSAARIAAHYAAGVGA